MNNLQLVLNIPEAEHIFVPFTALSINFRTDANRLSSTAFGCCPEKVKKGERRIFGHLIERHVT